MLSYQLKELATLGELLKQANKASQGINLLVEKVDQKLYTAQSAILWAQDFKYIFQDEPQSLADFNDVLRDLIEKKENVMEMWLDLQKSKQTIKQEQKTYQNQQAQNKVTAAQYKSWASRPRATPAVAMTHTAQHTGASVYEQAKTNEHLIEIKSYLSRMYKIITDDRAEKLKDLHKQEKFYKVRTK